MSDKQKEIKEKVTGENKKSNKIEKKENNKTNKVLLTILLILIILLIAVGIIWGGKILNKVKLDREIKMLYENDINTVDYNNITLQTTGDFSTVENEIKSFFKDYSSKKEAFLKKVNDEKIISMLTVENYKTDGPEFTESIKYVEDQKEEFNNISQEFINLLDKDNILSRIENKNISECYKELYKGYFFENNELNQDIVRFSNDINDSTELMNKLYETELKMLNFLKENKDNWEILNNQLTFDNEEFLKQYDELKKEILS